MSRPSRIARWLLHWLISRRVGQPVIEQLRDISQCSSHLAIRDGRDIIYIARVSAAGSRIREQLFKLAAGNIGQQHAAKRGAVHR
jgi:DNA-binding IclR family transcriptional regulator